MTPATSDTRAVILDTAQQLIISEGLQALTLDRVARDAGLSKGGLLYHFSSKEQLIEALVNRVISRLDAETAQASASGPRALIEARLDGNRDVLTVLIAGLVTNPALLDRLREQYHARQRIIERNAEPATVAHLAAEGLAFCEQLGLITLSPQKRASIVDQIINLTERTDMREQPAFFEPAPPPRPPILQVSARAELRNMAKRAAEAAQSSAAALTRLQDSAGFWRGDLTAPIQRSNPISFC
jgi:AcrR family transcriptional regulator